MAGGELLIPTLVLIFGADIKTAGSASILISLGVVSMGLWRYWRAKAIPTGRGAQRITTAMALGSIIGAALGGLAVAYAPQKIRVNAIAPSATMTERVRLLVAGNANLQKLADSHLVGLIEPEDIAHCALYLASDESRMVTGQVIPVDSGVTIS